MPTSSPGAVRCWCDGFRIRGRTRRKSTSSVTTATWSLLRVGDESFFEGIPPVEFGDLPEVRSAVVTYGYPAGGEQISYTRGVVSRIELQNYVHIGNRSLLAVQTDAAINPGNSGGPVIQDDRVVGGGLPGSAWTGERRVLYSARGDSSLPEGCGGWDVPRFFRWRASGW
jgi:hypothetical protein